jgi:hypothetical protein
MTDTNCGKAKRLGGSEYLYKVSHPKAELRQSEKFMQLK